MARLTVNALKQEIDELKTLITKLVEQPAPVAASSGKDSCVLKVSPKHIYATFAKEINGRVFSGYLVWSDTYRLAGRPPKGRNMHIGVPLIIEEAQAQGCEWLVDSLKAGFDRR